MRSSSPKRATAIVVALLSIAATACSGGSDDASDTPDEVTAEAGAAASAGLRLVSVGEGADIQANPPDDLVILDVRTPEEFAEGHLDGATMIDFYEADFAEQLANLDPDVPYLVYCRSGNRSGQTIGIMRELGFTDVADVDGGVIAWGDADLPLVTE